MNRYIIILIIFCGALVSCERPPATPNPPATLEDTTIMDISYAEPEACLFDLYLPGSRTDTTPVIILIHGGGWSSGSRAELSFLAKRFKEKGFVVANMDYRLSPQSDDNFKMQLDDIASLQAFLLGNAFQYTYSKTLFYITGHSAGAHLSLSYAYTRNENHLIKAAGGMATPTNLHSMAYYDPNLYAPLLTPYLGAPLSGATDARYKSASPYFQATSSAVPTILFQGDLDIIVNKQQAIGMAARLKELGVAHKLIIYPLVFHDWWTNATFVNNTVEETSSWFRNHKD